MEWLRALLEQFIGEDGKFDLTKAMEEVKTEFPKQAVPKETFNQKLEDLKTANKLVEDLKKDNADVETLQTKITEYETKVQELEATRASEKRTYELTSKLKDQGATDVDYMIYKLGDTPIEEIDNKIKELKEQSPTQFKAKEDVDDTTPKAKGFKVLDSKLDDGEESTSQPSNLLEAIKEQYEPSK